VFHVGTLLDDADLETPDGRDRALDEVVPVLKAMPDSITRDELMRDVGERLGADPGLVARKLAAAPRTPRLAPTPAPAEASDGGGEDSPFVPVHGASEAPRALSVQELRERGLLRMCIAEPAHGRDYIEKLKREHLSTPAMGRVRDWLAEHLDAPTDGLPEGDDELARIVSGLVDRAADEPASPEAMELSFLQLEQGAIERRIAEAAATGATEASVELQKRRAALSEQIAHHQSEVPRQSIRR
jgi:DNA primase